MAKIGNEIEGKRNYGMRTLFLAWSEVSTHNMTAIKDLVNKHNLDQIYICDHQSLLDYKIVMETLRKNLIDCTVTFELTEVPENIPDDAGIMLNISNGTSIEQLNRLRYHDEVKVSVGLDVYSWTMDDAVRTFPEEFENDFEVVL